MSARRNTEDKFWAQTDRSGECWLWTGLLAPSGYGRASFANKRWRAHRLAWTLTYGEIPQDLLVCHECDTPRCIKPTHLFLGTPLENMQDMVAKGRGWQPTGEASHNAKLTAQQVFELRLRYVNEDVSQRTLAKDYGVSQTQISSIIRGDRWGAQ